MSLLKPKLARRDEKGRYSPKYTYVKAIVIFTVIGTIIGIGKSAITNATHDDSNQVVQGSDMHGRHATSTWESGRLYEGCQLSSEGTYDCTEGYVRERVYEAAKKGIKWYTKPETNEEKLEAVCQSKGIADSDCPRILKAMSMQESGFGKWMVGDNSKSHGWFHILNIHKDVSLKCATDLTCSATWTLSRMIRNGYMQDKWKGVASHNSFTPSVGAAYAKAVKKQLAKL